MIHSFTQFNGGLTTALRAGHKPLRTTKELADEFGISVLSLAGFLKASGIKPHIDGRLNCSASKVWYEPVEVRAWWKKRNAS